VTVLAAPEISSRGWWSRLGLKPCIELGLHCICLKQQMRIKSFVLSRAHSHTYIPNTYKESSWSETIPDAGISGLVVYRSWSLVIVGVCWSPLSDQACSASQLQRVKLWGYDYQHHIYADAQAPDRRRATAAVVPLLPEQSESLSSLFSIHILRPPVSQHAQCLQCWL